MIVDKRLKLTFFFLLLLVGLPSVTIISIPQNNGFVYTFHYDSQSVFNPYIKIFNTSLSPLALSNGYPLSLYHTSVFDLAISYGWDLLELDFNPQFTHLTSVEQYNLSFLRSYISSIGWVVTNGQEFFVLGYNVSVPYDSYKIFVLNKTLTILQTIPFPCFSETNSTPYTDCVLFDMNLWNNSLWFLKQYYYYINNHSTFTQPVLVSYNISSFKIEHQYFLPTKASLGGVFTQIVPVNKQTLWLYYEPVTVSNVFIGYYAFDPGAGVVTKMMADSIGRNNSASPYPLIVSAEKALVINSDPFNSAQLDDVMVYSIITLPVLSVQTILINNGIFTAIITLIIWFTEIKVLIRRISTYFDKKLFS